MNFSKQNCFTKQDTLQLFEETKNFEQRLKVMKEFLQANSKARTSAKHFDKFQTLVQLQKKNSLLEEKRVQGKKLSKLLSCANVAHIPMQQIFFQKVFQEEEDFKSKVVEIGGQKLLIKLQGLGISTLQDLQSLQTEQMNQLLISSTLQRKLEAISSSLPTDCEQTKNFHTQTEFQEPECLEPPSSRYKAIKDLTDYGQEEFVLEELVSQRLPPKDQCESIQTEPF